MDCENTVGFMACPDVAIPDLLHMEALMIPDLEWYGASVQLEHISTHEPLPRAWIDWAYIELKARSQACAEDKLKRMFRDGIKIVYCQLI